ncbi:hypothetical protein diail_1450, partial [Diaporthe ilicicola]
MAIQLLRLSGFEVITTFSPRNFELVESYGACMVFDYSVPEVALLMPNVAWPALAMMGVKLIVFHCRSTAEINSYIMNVQAGLA